MSQEERSTTDADVPRTVEDIRTAVSALLGTPPQDIPADANLVRLGLSSLDMMRLSGRWRRGGVPVNFEVLVADPTVNGWAHHVGAVGTGSGAESASSD